MTQRARDVPTWPPLPPWEDTRTTVHLWTQIVGKIRLALEPMINHWWQVPLYVSARGLTTSLMHAGERGLEIEFDFVHHMLVLRSTDGQIGRVVLEPRTVADFYQATMAALADLDAAVPILGRPVEMPEAIPFADDTRHRSYDPEAMHRFWLALLQAHRVLTVFRSRFVGKASPVHFFWGGFDLAVSRFSGRSAPQHPGHVPNCADWVMQMAYNREVSSCGFWPGGSPEGSFYAYAYPEPPGFATWTVQPAAAHYDPTLGEFLLPYEAVRTADDPDAAVLAFLQCTYEAAAIPGRWTGPPSRPTRPVTCGPDASRVGHLVYAGSPPQGGWAQWGAPASYRRGKHGQRYLHTPRPDRRRHTVVERLRGLPGHGSPRLGSSPGVPILWPRRLL